MMAKKLDSSNFLHTSEWVHNEFKSLLESIFNCYLKMLTDKVSISNDENSIRDILVVNYLNNEDIRKEIKIENYLFIREALEKSYGKTDITIYVKGYSFENTDAYFIIECKRLDSINTNGKTGLNGKYIENGILRFIKPGYYSSYYGLNGMLGFIIESMDINDNIEKINFICKNHFNLATQLKKVTSKSQFMYKSIHTNHDKHLTLYHLMLDMSSIIKPHS